MTCGHEWTHKADGRGRPYWLCGRCGALADVVADLIASRIERRRKG